MFESEKIKNYLMRYTPEGNRKSHMSDTRALYSIRFSKKRIERWVRRNMTFCITCRRETYN